MPGTENSGRRPDALTVMRDASMDARLTIEGLERAAVPLMEVVQAVQQTILHARESLSRIDDGIETERAQRARSAASAEAAATLPVAA